MKSWKLSIKPDSMKGLNAYEKCKSKSILGLGWHNAYINTHPNTLSEAKAQVEHLWGKWPYQLKYLIDDMKKGDHVWIHQNGSYHLCKVEDDKIILGKDIDQQYREYDLGHARSAKWIEIPDLYVTGAVQRGTIARRAIQPIKLSEEETKFNEFIFQKLSIDKNWKHQIDDNQLEKSIRGLSKEALFSLMSPDDAEDIVSAYMQNNGWILIKSTCFRSKPKFEFSMLNKKGETAQIQVKSGKGCDPLPPQKYKGDASTNNLIYLFSTNSTPYPGDRISNIHPIKHNDIHTWIVNNLWAITFPLKSRIWIHLNMEY